MNEIAFIVPGYNEAQSVGSSLPRLYNFLESQNCNFEILFVDDASIDNTTTLVNQLTKKFPKIKILKLAINKGKGFAVRQGMLNTNAQYRFFIDADIVISFESIQTCIDILRVGKCDVVVGNRRSKMSVAEGSTTFSRRLGSSIFNIFAKIILLPQIEDTQCPIKGFRGDVAEVVFESQIVPSYAFDVEVLYRAIKTGYRISQVPVKWQDIRPAVPLPILLKVLTNSLVDVVRVRCKYE